jgi:hypothetical protein
VTVVRAKSGSRKSNSFPGYTVRRMRDPTRQLLEAAAKVLRPLLDELVFLGGCATGLLLTDPASAGLRPTKDVDAITEVASYAEYTRLSERLRALGLTDDTSEGAPLCRWRHGQLIIDVMPTSEDVLGFVNRWYPPALGSAGFVQISDLQLRVITPVYFLATKLEAFRGRGGGDISGSHDLEDVVTVIDGRAEIIAEVRSAPADVRTFIASEFRQLLTARAFVDALPGFLLPDAANQARLPMLLERLTALAASES